MTESALNSNENVVRQTKSDRVTDLALTIPIFVLYHLGVVFLPVRNAADMVTTELRQLANQSLITYGAITLSIGACFAGFVLLIGEKKAFQSSRFVMMAFEGLLYATLMRVVGSYVVGALKLGLGEETQSPIFSHIVMSLGAGFYEEILFRVGLFGGGALLLKFIFGKGLLGLPWLFGWGLICSIIFSGWHYVGALGDPFDWQSFIFRTSCGAMLTLIFAIRGFAPAVWTHALYDISILFG